MFIGNSLHVTAFDHTPGLNNDVPRQSYESAEMPNDASKPRSLVSLRCKILYKMCAMITTKNVELK